MYEWKYIHETFLFKHSVKFRHCIFKSIYEPGKRHWLKVKKDYLADGAMADTADLLVLGAYYGTGRKGWISDITPTQKSTSMTTGI